MILLEASLLNDFDPYAFPVLYDVETRIGSMEGNPLKSKKGFYDYEKDLFVLPKNVFEKIKQDHPLDLEIVTMVGYEVKP